MAEPAENVAGTIDHRRYHRSTVLWPAELVWRRNTYQCIIFNISANGAKVMIKDAAEDMKMVTLCSPRFGEFEGEVMWRATGAIGMRFTAKPEEISRILGDLLPRVYERKTDGAG